MSRNVKILSDDDIERLSNYYVFIPTEYGIIVATTTYNRQVIHPYNEPFTLSNNKKKIKISVEAIDLWKNYFENFSLIRIQNAINILICSYETVSKEAVEKFLK